jgi:hypothetical protein
MRKRYPNIEKRIDRITDMEVVAWIVVCKFHCKLKGGFVRDWVVGEYTSRPIGMINNPKGWIQ